MTEPTQAPAERPEAVPHLEFKAALLVALNELWRTRLDTDAPRLQEIPGMVPQLTRPIVGCAFAARCPLATERCRTEPPMVDVGGGHTALCWEVTP